jgi:hypothetical protein
MRFPAREAGTRARTENGFLSRLRAAQPAMFSLATPAILIAIFAAEIACLADG